MTGYELFIFETFHTFQKFVALAKRGICTFLFYHMLHVQTYERSDKWSHTIMDYNKYWLTHKGEMSSFIMPLKKAMQNLNEKFLFLLHTAWLNTESIFDLTRRIQKVKHTSFTCDVFSNERDKLPFYFCTMLLCEHIQFISH